MVTTISCSLYNNFNLKKMGLSEMVNSVSKLAMNFNVRIKILVVKTENVWNSVKATNVIVNRNMLLPMARVKNFVLKTGVLQKIYVQRIQLAIGTVMIFSAIVMTGLSKMATYAYQFAMKINVKILDLKVFSG